jgi:uncharacterized protein
MTRTSTHYATLTLLAAIAVSVAIRPAAAATSLKLPFQKRPIVIEAVSQESERRKASRNPLGLLNSDTGLLLLYPHPRHHFFSVPRTLSSFKLRLFFLSSRFKVEEVTVLEPGSPGVTSNMETPYVLVMKEPQEKILPKEGQTLENWAKPVGKLTIEPMPQVRIGAVTISVELADTPESIHQGLMYRKRMSANEGMLFVYPDQQTRSHWMGHCYFPLSIAFAYEDGKIHSIQDMHPYPDPENPGSNAKTWQSKSPARYALETNMGFFEKHSLKEGMVILHKPSPTHSLKERMR